MVPLAKYGSLLYIALNSLSLIFALQRFETNSPSFEFTLV